MKLTSYRDQLFPFFMESYVAIRMARCFRLSLLRLFPFRVSGNFSNIKRCEIKKKTIVIVFLQHKCVFSTQIRQNAFRICVYVLNSTRQNIYFVLFHAHMAQLACMRAFSVRNQFILFVKVVVLHLCHEFHFLDPLRV